MVDVNFDTSSLERRLRKMTARIKNLPMDQVGQLLMTATDDMFESEGADGTDGPWEPLSPVTLKRHPRRVGGKILQDTGATANIQIVAVDELSVTIGSPTDYSKFHIDGTEEMPKRDFFALNYATVLEAAGDLVLEEVAT